MMGTEGAPPRLARLVVAKRPSVCVLQLERAYGEEPPLVESAALVFPDTTARRRGSPRRTGRRLPHGRVPEDVTARRRAGAIGDETVDARAGGRRHGRGLTGRAGRLLAGAPATCSRPSSSRASRTSRRRCAQWLSQAAAGANRAPRAGQDDERCPDALDDPSLRVPVYWLGASFAPEGFPAVDFYAGGPTGPGGGPGTELKLDYDSTDFKAGLHLDTWTPAAWKKFRRTPLGQGIWSSPCSTIRLPDRTATIYGACKTGPTAAAVEIGGVVVTVNMPYCLGCEAPSGYDTRAGAEAVIRGLHLRR